MNERERRENNRRVTLSKENLKYTGSNVYHRFRSTRESPEMHSP